MPACRFVPELGGVGAGRGRGGVAWRRRARVRRGDSEDSIADALIADAVVANAIIMDFSDSSDAWLASATIDASARPRVRACDSRPRVRLASARATRVRASDSRPRERLATARVRAIETHL